MFPVWLALAGQVFFVKRIYNHKGTQRLLSGNTQDYFYKYTNK
jgi:hypothetical protein